jgi:hypothetical protein
VGNLVRGMPKLAASAVFLFFCPSLAAMLLPLPFLSPSGEPLISGGIVSGTIFSFRPFWVLRSGIGSFFLHAVRAPLHCSVFLVSLLAYLGKRKTSQVDVDHHWRDWYVHVVYRRRGVRLFGWCFRSYTIIAWQLRCYNSVSWAHHTVVHNLSSCGILENGFLV